MKLAWQQKLEKELKVIRLKVQREAVRDRIQRLEAENQRLRDELKVAQEQRDSMYRWLVEEVNGLAWPNPNTPKTDDSNDPPIHVRLKEWLQAKQEGLI